MGKKTYSIAKLHPYWDHLKLNLLSIGEYKIYDKMCKCNKTSICYNCFLNISSMINLSNKRKKTIFFINFIKLLNHAIRANVNQYNNKYIKMVCQRNIIKTRVVVYLSNYDNNYTEKEIIKSNMIIGWFEYNTVSIPEYIRYAFNI